MGSKVSQKTVNIAWTVLEFTSQVKHQDGYLDTAKNRLICSLKSEADLIVGQRQ